MPADSAQTLRAHATLGAYLDASREGSSTRAALDTLAGCQSAEGGGFSPTSMLAAYELVDAEMRGDTLVGRAVVTTVAEVDGDRRRAGHFVASQRVRSDTLEWDVLPGADGRWVVCNGLQFGFAAPDSLTTWRPAGASYASAHALAESIAAMHRRSLSPRP